MKLVPDVNSWLALEASAQLMVDFAEGLGFKAIPQYFLVGVVDATEGSIPAACGLCRYTLAKLAKDHADIEADVIAVFVVRWADTSTPEGAADWARMMAELDRERVELRQ